MGLFFSVIFFFFGYLFYHIKRDIFYPPFVLYMVWGISIALIWTLGEYFENITYLTYAVFLTGTFMFGVGFTLAEIFIIGKTTISNNTSITIKKQSVKRDSNIITLLLVVFSVALPIYYYKITQISGLNINDPRVFFLQIRRAELDNTIDLGFFLRNMIPLSMFVSLYVYNLHKKHGKFTIRTYLLIVISLFFQLLTGGRAGAVYLLLAVVAVELHTTKKVKLKKIIFFVIILFAVIIFIAYFIGKGSIDNSRSIIENLDAIYKDFITYMLGGIVAFDRIVLDPDSISSNGGILRFFLQTANSLGFDAQAPNLHMEYTDVGSGIKTNVYTIYSSYYIDYGLIGTCIIMLIYGVTMSLVLKKAQNGNNIFVALYSYLMAGLILSIYSEHLFTDLNYIIKLVLSLSLIDIFRKFRLKNRNVKYI